VVGKFKTGNDDLNERKARVKIRRPCANGPSVGETIGGDGCPDFCKSKEVVAKDIKIRGWEKKTRRTSTRDWGEKKKKTLWEIRGGKGDSQSEKGE